MVSPLSLSPRAVLVAALVGLLPLLPSGCALPTLADRLPEFDARIRGDLDMPAQTPSPRLVIVDDARRATLGRAVVEMLRDSGGGLYDPTQQIIYLDRHKAGEGSLYHELMHHYFRFMSDAQRSECLARLYEIHVARSASFSGCTTHAPTK